MMTDEESSKKTNDAAMIRFRCPQCTRPWKVEAKHKGKKFRCPACFMERTIPDQSVEESVADLYGVNDTVRDTRDIIREQSLVSFRCRICRASLALPTDRVGQTITCPDCDTPNVVPEPKPKAEAQEPAAPIEIYGVSGHGGGTDLPPGDDVFSLYCPICNTLLYARDEQIGTTIRCPDCDRDVPVRGRPEKPIKVKHVPKVYEGSSTYELLAENQLPPDTQLVPIVCSLCYTRMYATIDQVGREKECPDCGKMNLIKPVAKEAVKTAGELFATTGGYGVGKVTQRPKMRVNVDYRTVEGAVVDPNDPDAMNYVDPAEMAERIREKEEQRKRLAKTPKAGRNDEDEPTAAEKLEARAQKRSQGIGVVTFRRAKLPQRPLTKGYWKLFAHSATYVHAIMSMLFFFLVAPLVVPLVEQYASEVTQLAGGSREGVIIYLFMYIITGIFWLGGLCYLSQICLAVAMSTANGADEVDDWGGFSPMGALWSLICVGGAVAVGWSPAILWNVFLRVTKSPDGIPGHIMLICAAVSFIVFPVMLMRLLEGFDRHVLKSNTLWSLRLVSGTWLRFYLLSSLCLIVPAFLFRQLLYSPDTTFKMISSFGIAFFMPLCAMCYFRLFGRLAWVVETAVGKKLQELEDLAAAEEDDGDDKQEERSYDARIDLPDHALRD